jgi:glycosyltransferase involved in cell wall biosynthesis
MDFTIVTPSLGQLEYLECCISSVADQEGVSIEHIVQDAGTNGFTEFAEKMRQRWPDRPNYRRVMLSEPDTGMYDAINKGLKKGTGRICAYLNCDEQYLAGALAKVMEEFKKQSAIEVLYGGFLVVDEKGDLVTAQRPVKMFWQHVATSHLPNFTCATFFKREMMEKEKAYFDVQYRACADAVWTIERLKRGTKMGMTDDFIGAFVEQETNQGVKKEGLAEADAIRRRLPPHIRSKAFAWRAAHRLRKLLQGKYFPKRVSYDIFRKGDLGKRSHFPAKWANPFWRTRLRMGQGL